MKNFKIHIVLLNEKYRIILHFMKYSLSVLYHISVFPTPPSAKSNNSKNNNNNLAKVITTRGQVFQKCIPIPELLKW